jgi:hypothetical protein
MPAAILGPIAGSVVGGLMSDGGEEQTATKEPWSAAAPWLRENIAQGQNLQAYYQQNPWNSLQQTGYQNIYGDLDNFRNSIAPGMMDFANRLMGTNYSRGGTTMQNKPQAMPRSGAQSGNGGMLSGLLSGAGQQSRGSSGPFSVSPGQSYGLLDFRALNPYNGALKPDQIKQPDQQTVEQAVQAELDRRQREAQQNDRFA